MPKLKNPKYELQAKALVKHNFNKTQAYLNTHPGCSYNTANSNGNNTKIQAQASIQQRAIEIAEQAGLGLKDIIQSLDDDLNATKPLIHGKRLKYTRDNTNILKAKELLLRHVHNIGQKDEESRPLVNINLSTVDITALTGIVEDLKALDRRIERDEQVQDGEILD